MPGKNAREAIAYFAGFLNETLGCLTDRKLAAHQEADNTFKLFYKDAVPVASKSGTLYYLQVTQVCNTQVVGDGTFKAHTRHYSYVFSDSTDASNYGVLSYHWHPNDFSLRDPHLHIRISQELGYPEIERRISRAHFPTSRVCLEDFAFLLLNYYDIKSPLDRSKYLRILKRNKRAFSKGATWTVQCP